MSILKKAHQWAAFGRTWHLYDCKYQNPFDSAKIIRTHLMGLHKPIYHPQNDCGDHVVLMNTAYIALPGEEWTRRVYFHHTQAAGGATWTLAHELHEKNKTKIMYYAVYGSMRGNLQRRHTIRRLLLFPDEKIPREVMGNISNQLRVARPIPTPLHEHDKETIEKFPKIVDYPKNYVIE